MNETLDVTTDGAEAEALTPDEKIYIERLKLTDDVISISLIVLTGLGLLGNALVYATVQHLQKSPQFRNSSLTYLKWLAFADSSSVIIDGWLTKGFTFVFGFQVRSLGLWVCRLDMWASHFTTRAAANIMAAFTFDRFISVTFPFFYDQKMKRPKVAKVISLVIWLVCALVAGPLLFILVIRDERCTISADIPMRVIDTFIFIGTPVLLVGIPSSVAFFSNFMIIIGLRKRAKRDRERKGNRQTSGQGGAGGGRKEYSMTTLLIVSSLLFLAGESGVMWGNYVMFYSEADPQIHPQVQKQFRTTATSISELCGAINSSLNFVIYIICSRRFNLAFRDMLNLLLRGKSAMKGAGQSTATQPRAHSHLAVTASSAGIPGQNH
ncbi:dopamine receptor 2-like [Symsagittifera roscoffensis]|uniref:dopamine receptor 2-like n=1 Tax=Symsagittifera roscoffensis TaxID=84072 RepID=UPI00307BC438